jgi:hypothetical protein
MRLLIAVPPASLSIGVASAHTITHGDRLAEGRRRYISMGALTLGDRVAGHTFLACRRHWLGWSAHGRRRRRQGPQIARRCKKGSALRHQARAAQAVMLSGFSSYCRTVSATPRERLWSRLILLSSGRGHQRHPSTARTLPCVVGSLGAHAVYDRWWGPISTLRHCERSRQRAYPRGCGFDS